MPAQPDACAAITAGHFFEPEAWAQANHIGISLIRAGLRRENNPIPHLRIGRKYLIDDALAVEWFRRELGVGVAL